MGSVTINDGQTTLAGVPSGGYNLFGLPTGVNLGSGDSDTFTYDGNTGRMTGYKASLGGLPWVSMAVTGPQSGASYFDTDSFTLTVKGAPYQQVTVCQGTPCTPYPMGTTDSTGTWSVSSSWGGGYVGTYKQVWAVGGVNAAPTLNFSVISTTPTPAGPTTSTLGPSSSGTLTWNQNGSLAKLAAMDGFNSANAATCAYQHDDLGRLSSADCGNNQPGPAQWGQTFSYDPFGNIKKYHMTGHNPSTDFALGYDPATNHFTGTPLYDGNGNLQSDGTNAYTWDADGNLTQFNGTTMVYDALGRRVEQITGGVTTEILYSVDGSKLALMNGSTLTKAFAPLPGGATAVYNSSGLAWYRHADWLGSSRLASTPSRTLYSDGSYSPFGEDAGHAPGASDPNFTGQNQDLTGAGGVLFDFPAREYNQVEGRWVSPDPAGVAAVDPTNPQSWNRYGYVNNSPLNLVDPYGLDDCPGGCVPFETRAINSYCTEYMTYYKVYVGGTEYDMPNLIVVCTFPTSTTFDLSRQDGPGGAGGGAGRGGGASVGTAASNNSIKQEICKLIPSGRTTGGSVGVGGVGSPGGGGEVVVNYNSGQVSAFVFGGVQVGWNGGISGSVYTGFVYGLNDSNSNYSGGFTGANGGAGPGAFAARSSGGLTGGPGGLVPNPSGVTAGGISFGGGLLGGASFGVTATNYSKPLQLGKYSGFSQLDWLLYAARQVCK